MKLISSVKGCKSKIIALILLLCVITSFVPTVLAESISAESSEDQSSASTGRGFENVEQDGGTLFIGTARIPKANSDSFVSVKYIYSDGITLNEKSLKLIQDELKYSGISISGDMTTVSDSNVSESSIVTDDQQSIFACGSESKPTELTAYPSYETVEKSFNNLFKGYIFSISGYASFKNIFEGRDEIQLSEDGQTAYTSVVMDEDYVEKVINGKTVTILMINSELKYSFRAPKITFVKDENYVASPSDVTSSVQTGSETQATTSTETTTTSSTTVSTTASTTTATETTTTTTAADVTSTTSSAGLTAGASPVTSTAPQTTTSSAVQTSSSSAASTTAAGTTTVAASAAVQTTAPTTTATQGGSTTSTVNPIFGRTTENRLSSDLGIVNTRRLPLNIRSGPGTNYMVVTVLPKGSYVTVLDTSNSNWYMVKTMGKVVGYAYSKYIRIM